MRHRFVPRLGRRGRWLLGRLALVCLVPLWATVGLIGCGTWPTFLSDYGFPNALVDFSGEDIHIATLGAIVSNDDLDDAEKREALEELGIEDEDLQDYILENF